MGKLEFIKTLQNWSGGFTFLHELNSIAIYVRHTHVSSSYIYSIEYILEQIGKFDGYSKLCCSSNLLGLEQFILHDKAFKVIQDMCRVVQC